MGIISVYILLRIQPIGIPLDRDEGVFGLVGRTILEGGLPYQDGIDHKPPLVFYIYAVMLSIFPPTAIGIHLFLHLYNLFTLIVTFLFAKRVAGINTAYWVAFLYGIFSINPYVQGFTASTEMFMLLPIMLSLWLALVATENGRLHLVSLVLSGIFGALACWCKQPAVFSVFFSLIIIVYRLWQFHTPENRIRDVIKAILIWLAAGVSISLLIIAYFSVHGILDEFLYWSFQHSLLYSAEQSLADRFVMVWYGLLRTFTYLPFLFVLAILSIFFNHKKMTFPVSLFLMSFLLSMLGVSMGFAYPHYYAQLIPPLVILAGLSCSSIVDKFGGSILKLNATAAILVMAILVEVLPNSDYYLKNAEQNFSRHFFGINLFSESTSIASYLKKNTSPEDKIFVYGSEPQILLLAERPSATAFYVVYPLMRSEFSRYLEFQDRVIDEIKSSRPKYIISVLLPPSLLYDGKAELKISKFLTDYVDKYYLMEERLIFSEEKQSWISQNHDYYKQGGKPSSAAIVFLRRIED